MIPASPPSAPVTRSTRTSLPLVPIVPPEDSSKEVAEVYEEFYRRMSFPSAPNFIMTQGHSKVACRGTWELVSNVLVSGEIPRWMKEIVFVAISRDRNCQYCEAAHVACCRMLGINSEMLQEIASNIENLSNPKVRAMVRFALKCSRNPQSLAEADYDKLRTAGLSQSEIVELIAMSGLAVYANIMADATRMEADPMFATVGAVSTAQG